MRGIDPKKSERTFIRNGVCNSGLQVAEIMVVLTGRLFRGVQREGKHLGIGKTIENERSIGLDLEVFRLLRLFLVNAAGLQVPPRLLI